MSDYSTATGTIDNTVQFYPHTVTTSQPYAAVNMHLHSAQWPGPCVREGVPGDGVRVMGEGVEDGLGLQRWVGDPGGKGRCLAA